jgi:hypothetical protein
MPELGPPWAYIKPEYVYGFGASAVFLLAITLLLLLAFFVHGFFKRRHEVRLARIQSGNLDPIQTSVGAFLFFRRGLILIFIGIDLAICAVAEHPAPLVLMPFFIGLAYILIYILHASGKLSLFPANGGALKERKEIAPVAESGA